MTEPDSDADADPGLDPESHSESEAASASDGDAAADRPDIEAVPAETAGVIEHETDEVTALCPFDDFRDFYRVRVEYRPDEHAIEIASLRRYLDSFANEEVSHERFCESLFGAIAAAVDPAELTVVCEPNHYEGFDTRVTRTL